MGLNFKVNFSNGASIKLLNLPDDTTLDALKAQLFEKSGIAPDDQHGKCSRCCATYPSTKS